MTEKPGRTTEQLKEAAELAGAGRQVAYIVHTQAMVGYAIAILRDLTGPEEVLGAVVSYAGGGSVHVLRHPGRMGMSRLLRGSHWVVIEDHAASDPYITGRYASGERTKL